MNKYTLGILSALVFLLMYSLPVESAEVRLWKTYERTNGALGGGSGGRSGADRFCQDDRNKPELTESETRAFVSISTSDEIRDMVGRYHIADHVPVYRADGTT